MATITRLLALTIAGVATAFTIGIQPATAVPPLLNNGPCLFGHVDPNDNNSACRLGDGWKESGTRPDGTPSLSCSRLNANDRVKTDAGEHGWRYWTCKSKKDAWGHTVWEWYEVLHA